MDVEVREMVFAGLLLLLFTLGSSLLWFTLLSRIRFGRTSRMAWMLDRLRSQQRLQVFASGGKTPLGEKGQAFAERARLAGLPAAWSLRRFRLVQAGFALLLSFMLAALELTLTSADPAALEVSATALCRLAAAAFTGWWLPMVIVWAAAGQKKTRYLLEIAKLSQRLSVCVSDQADIRELLVRAGRPLALLRPHLQELTVLWGKNRRAAIRQFRESVGLTEVFPLVNALEAISQAEAKEVAKVLKEQTASIEVTLAADIQRRIENAPVWISFYIMIPFFMIVLLFLYPWIATISQQLMTSFQQ